MTARSRRLYVLCVVLLLLGAALGTAGGALANGGAADLAIIKSGPATAVPGTSIAYTIVVSNNGPVDATGVAVSDVFPTSLTSVSWTTSGGGSGFEASGTGDIDDTGGTLPPAVSVTYSVTATIDPDAAGMLVNAASVTSSVVDPNPVNDSSSVTTTLTPRCDLSIVKSDAAGVYVPGMGLTYTIVVRNDGPSTATGARVTDDFAPVLSGASWTAYDTVCTYDPSGVGDIDELVTMPPDGVITYRAHVDVSEHAEGPLSNTATVAAPAGTTDPDPSDNSSTDTDAIVEYQVHAFAGPHGDVSPWGDWYPWGSEPTFTFTPELGYHVERVTVDGRPVLMTGYNEYTFAPIWGPHELRVWFAIDMFVITPRVFGGMHGHGTVFPATPQLYPWGSRPTFTFWPEKGYYAVSLVIDWSASSFTRPNQYTFAPLTADHELAVGFAPVPGPQPQPSYVITTTVAGGQGSISPPGPLSVSRNSTPTFYFVPRTGWHVASVTVDGAPVSMTGVNSYTFPRVTGPHALAVTFAEDAFTITASVTGGHGTISPSGATPVAFGSTPTFTFAPDPGYKVGQILVDGVAVTPSAPNAYTFAVVVADHTISVSFTESGPPGPMPGGITVRTPRSASVKQGKVASLKYRVEQAVLEGTADVTVVVTDQAGNVRKTLYRYGVSLNQVHSARFVCNFARGVYTFKVTAISNGQPVSNTASNTLTVR